MLRRCVGAHLNIVVGALLQPLEPRHGHQPRCNAQPSVLRCRRQISSDRKTRPRCWRRKPSPSALEKCSCVGSSSSSRPRARNRPSLPQLGHSAQADDQLRATRQPIDQFLHQAEHDRTPQHCEAVKEECQRRWVGGHRVDQGEGEFVGPLPFERLQLAQRGNSSRSLSAATEISRVSKLLRRVPAQGTAIPDRRRYCSAKTQLHLQQKSPRGQRPSRCRMARSRRTSTCDVP